MSGHARSEVFAARAGRPSPLPRRGDHRAVLRRLAEDEIIPRLHAKHLGGGGAHRAPAPCDRKRRLIADLLGPDPARAVGEWRATLAALGADAALRLLTDGARLLGTEWVEDRLSFADVTVATLHLQALLRGLAPAAATAARARSRCLLLPVPGEQHVFGVAMLAHVFRDAGWHVDEAAAADTGDLASLAARLRPDVVGLSAGAEMHLSRIVRSVAAIRRVLPGVPVLVGGPVFLLRPELAARVGADATAPDAASAVGIAASLVAARAAPTSAATAPAVATVPAPSVPAERVFA